MKKVSGIVIGGIITLIGAAALLKPLQSFYEIGWLAGALLVIRGVERIYRALVEQNMQTKKIIFRVVEIIVGAGIAVGTILNVVTDLVIAYAAGAIVIAYGVYFIMHGIKVAERDSGKILRAGIGLLVVGLGAVLLYEPEGTIIAVLYAVATAFALQGVDIIMIAMVGRKEAFEE